jgi:ADP-ribosylation factor 2-binding protein
LVEKYLENNLKKRIENFSMEEFMKDLMSRRDELDGEIFEILLTFEDFLEFKQLMLSFKSVIIFFLKIFGNLKFA